VITEVFLLQFGWIDRDVKLSSHDVR